MFYKFLVMLILFSGVASGQSIHSTSTGSITKHHIIVKPELIFEGAWKLFQNAKEAANSINKNVSIAILNSEGTILLLARGDGVGPHNTEAARKKAFTALSTKTATLQLARNAAKNDDTKNLATVTDLLLLGGGVPLWHNGELVGSLGVAGGGSPENDDLIARSSQIVESDIITN